MNSREERLWSSLAIVVIVACLILAYAYFFGPATMFIWQAKQEAARNPGLARVPIPLPDTSISSNPGTSVTLFGYQFEVPWQGQVIVKTSGDYAADVHTVSGKPFVFFNPANEPRVVKSLQQGLKERGEDPRNADLVLNSHSDYELERSVLYATPAQLSLVFPRKKEVWAAVSLMVKQAEAQGAETGLYSFQIGELRGFQIGDPSRARSVRVKAFDGDDRESEFVFGFSPGPDYSSKQGFTQTDINTVLQTLRPSPASPH